MSIIQNGFKLIENLGAKGVSYIRGPGEAPAAINIYGQDISTALRWNLNIPGTKIEYEKEVGDVTLNSAVAACLFWIIRNFPEAPLEINKKDKTGLYLPIDEGHPMTDLIDNPNENYSSNTLWAGTLISYNINGNAYWLKVRDNVGRVKELWYLPHTLVVPRWPRDGSKFISHYDYFPGNREIVRIDPKDIIHFRHILDINNYRVGQAPLVSLLREVYTDNEASNFSAALLKNMGIPGIMISPTDKDSVIEPEAAEKLKADFTDRFSKDGRGKPMVMSAGVKIDQLALDPQKMDLLNLHHVPASRIAAVLGIPAQVVGLDTGNSNASTYKEARMAAYDGNLIPTKTALAIELKRQLLPEFEKDTRQFKVFFNTSNVRVLQPDMTAVFTRYDMGVRGGWIKRSEARKMAGLPITPEDDVYLINGIDSSLLNEQQSIVNEGQQTNLELQQNFLKNPSLMQPPPAPSTDTPSTGDSGGNGNTPAPDKTVIPKNDAASNAKRTINQTANRGTPAKPKLTKSDILDSGMEQINYSMYIKIYKAVNGIGLNDDVELFNNGYVLNAINFATEKLKSEVAELSSKANQVDLTVIEAKTIFWKQFINFVTLSAQQNEFINLDEME